MCQSCDDYVARNEENIKAATDQLVQEGIALLNTDGPADWRERINLDTLDIADVQLCVLGQVYADKVGNPDFTRYSSLYGQRTWSNGYDFGVCALLEGGYDYAASYGFSYDGNINGSDMTAAWKRALTTS